ncbi:hypothetical protein BDZ88DRAFT_413708 [Geranomyces variabilis]|nr:hypothetical protein BDZ88DRAFT_413708 [Geranomyces variabilis]KAJ3137171.1 hypothetical protein HDU90_002343 [Geranomyces variabilis]
MSSQPPRLADLPFEILGRIVVLLRNLRQCAQVNRLLRRVSTDSSVQLSWARRFMSTYGNSWARLISDTSTWEKPHPSWGERCHPATAVLSFPGLLMACTRVCPVPDEPKIRAEVRLAAIIYDAPIMDLLRFVEPWSSVMISQMSIRFATEYASQRVLRILLDIFANANIERKRYGYFQQCLELQDVILKARLRDNINEPSAARRRFAIALTMFDSVPETEKLELAKNLLASSIGDVGIMRLCLERCGRPVGNNVYETANVFMLQDPTFGDRTLRSLGQALCSVFLDDESRVIVPPLPYAEFFRVLRHAAIPPANERCIPLFLTLYLKKKPKLKPFPRGLMELVLVTGHAEILEWTIAEYGLKDPTAKGGIIQCAFSGSANHPSSRPNRRPDYVLTLERALKMVRCAQHAEDAEDAEDANDCLRSALNQANGAGDLWTVEFLLGHGATF